jgi:hypothetical protein
MRTQKAIRECAEWLSYCLRLGWKKSQLDRLEEIWWEFHDDNGKLRDAR